MCFSVRCHKLILTAAGLVVLAGCTAPAPPAVATARTGAAPGRSSAAPGRGESDYDKALRYTRCMTAHGDPVPDPVVGKPLPLGRPDQGAWVTGASKPFAACRQYLPTTWPVKVDPEAVVKERRFDECLRQHGIPVPQPDAQGMVHYPADPFVPQSPRSAAAEQACRKYYDDPANRLPENQ